jgi:hypothetical protein
VPTNPPQERDKNKLATTNVTNEHARAIASLIEARTGQVDDDFIPGNPPFLIHVTATRAGVGKYVAYRVKASAGDVTAADTTELLAMNVDEIGWPGPHTITPGTNTIYPAFFVQTNADGMPVVGFFGDNPMNCPDT